MRAVLRWFRLQKRVECSTRRLYGPHLAHRTYTFFSHSHVIHAATPLDLSNSPFLLHNIESQSSSTIDTISNSFIRTYVAINYWRRSFLTPNKQSIISRHKKTKHFLVRDIIRLISTFVKTSHFMFDNIEEEVDPCVTVSKTEKEHLLVKTSPLGISLPVAPPDVAMLIGDTPFHSNDEPFYRWSVTMVKRFPSVSPADLPTSTPRHSTRGQHGSVSISDPPLLDAP